MITLVMETVQIRHDHVARRARNFLSYIVSQIEGTDGILHRDWCWRNIIIN